MTKVCSTCHIEQELAAFTNAKSNKDGLAHHCKKCDRARYRAYYERNKQKVAAKNAFYRRANPEKHQQYSKKYYESNKAAHRQREMAYQVKRRQQTPSWLSKAYIAEMEGLYMFCQLFSGYQVDHIVPVRGGTVSGLHVPWNLQVLTRSENAQKSNTFNPSVYPEQGTCTYMENSI